jgi:hypothetical protein
MGKVKGATDEERKQVLRESIETAVKGALMDAKRNLVIRGNSFEYYHTGITIAAMTALIERYFIALDSREDRDIN